MEPATLTTSDGFELEARWDVPAHPCEHTVVFCHPHPLHGGTMTAPLMDNVTEHLIRSGMAVLRFNFRGVGSSEGHWGKGVAEVRDVAAAMAAARDASPEVSLVGWSFGAATALRFQASEGDTAAYVGIAPPVRGSEGATLPVPAELARARRTILIGERDQLIDVDDVRAYAANIGADFHVLAASDHFFHFRERRVAEHVTDALMGAQGQGG